MPQRKKTRRSKKNTKQAHKEDEEPEEQQQAKKEDEEPEDEEPEQMLEVMGKFQALGVPVESSSAKKWRRQQQEAAHLKFPTEKDQEKLDRGEQWVFAEGPQVRQLVCEQEVEVLILDSVEGADILGHVVGTTTKPLDAKAKLIKRCSLCDNKHPGLTDEDGKRMDPYFRTMLLGQEDPTYEGLGGSLHDVCYQCFLDDDGGKSKTKDYHHRLNNADIQWSDITFTMFQRL